ncbi:MAG: M16 family metallopeptidase [Gemmatimonadaceae bacterium]
MTLISLPSLAPETVLRTRLDNGLTVLVRRDDSAPVVAIVTHVKAGYFDETDDIVGIAHVLEHMYFKGTPTRGVGEISKETKAAGGYLNAGTIYDYTSYYTVLPSSGFVSGLEIQADAYANSSIAADELRKELEVIIQEAKRKADNPGAVTIETLYELLHDSHRMRRWRIGREEGLRALTRADLVALYRNFYRPRNTILVIVGDIDPDDALSRVQRLYASIDDGEIVRSEGPMEPDREGFRFRELAGDITQTHFAFGWRTAPTLHADTPLLDAAAAVLGTGRASRLYRTVRERKLAASVSAYNYTPTDLGVFVVQAEGPPDTSLEAARMSWAQVRDLREAGIGRDELWRARRIFESQWIRRLETMEGQANHLAEWEALGDWTLGDVYLERLLTSTPEQVTEAVRRYLAPDRGALLLYRPASAAPTTRAAEEMAELLEASQADPPAAQPPVVAVASPPVSRGPSLEREIGRVRIYRTPSGVPVLVRRKASAIVHLGVHALGGATEEPVDVAGLTSLMARTAIKGTTRRSAAQLAEEAETLGGSISPSAGSESFGWSISVPAVHLDAAMALLAEVVTEATFADDALATERTIAIADLALLRDDMYRYPMRLLTQGAFAGHPYGLPASGLEDTIARVDAARVREWHRTRVLEGPLVVGIVGDVDPDDAAALAASRFATLRMGEASTLEAPRWPEAPVTVVESRQKAQTALAIAFPSAARGDPSRYAAGLIGGVASGLGGRFFDELRDRRSLAYTVHAHALERRLAGMFVAYIATSPEKEQEAREGLLAEFAKLREADVTEEELTQAKAYALGTHAIRQQSGGAVLAEMIDAWLVGTGLEELDRFDACVRGVTAREMRELARRYFDEGRVVEGIVRGSRPTTG